MLEINELVKVPNGLNDLKTKVDDLNVGKLKTVPVEKIKNLKDEVSKEVVEKILYNKLNPKVNSLEKSSQRIYFNSEKQLLKIQHRKIKFGEKNWRC